MFLEEGHEKILKYIDIPFGEIFTKDTLADVIRSKGKTGHLLETLIGLPHCSNKLDFADGELKTVKSNDKRKPMETMAITQIGSNRIDSLLNGEDFQNAPVSTKLSNMLFVPIQKTGKPENWMFLKPILVCCQDNRLSDFYRKIEEDYYAIVQRANDMVINKGVLHTLNGPNKYLQIRTKDSKPYHPIFSQKYQKEISDKCRAFFLRKDALKSLLQVAES